MRALLPALAALLLAAANPARSAEAGEVVAALKQAYLACDRRAAQRRLAPAEMQACASIGERLLQQGFDGDWDRLLAWWRVAREDLS